MSTAERTTHASQVLAAQEQDFYESLMGADLLLDEEDLRELTGTAEDDNPDEAEPLRFGHHRLPEAHKTILNKNGTYGHYACTVTRDEYYERTEGSA